MFLVSSCRVIACRCWLLCDFGMMPMTGTSRCSTFATGGPSACRSLDIEKSQGRRSRHPTRRHRTTLSAMCCGCSVARRMTWPEIARLISVVVVEVERLEWPDQPTASSARHATSGNDGRPTLAFLLMRVGVAAAFAFGRRSRRRLRSVVDNGPTCEHILNGPPVFVGRDQVSGELGQRVNRQRAHDVRSLIAVVDGDAAQHLNVRVVRITDHVYCPRPGAVLNAGEFSSSAGVGGGGGGGVPVPARSP